MKGEYTRAALTALSLRSVWVRVTDTETEPTVRMCIDGQPFIDEPGREPGFTPTEARKLGDALYAAALECELEINRRKLRVVRDPDGARGVDGAGLWYAAFDGVIYWEYAVTADEARAQFLDSLRRTPLMVGVGLSGWASPARFRCFADLLEGRP